MASAIRKIQARLAKILVVVAGSWALLVHLRLALGVITAPAARRLGYVPDDAFYYLELARNHAAGLGWTFDGGVSTTNGFHLLHAYSLAAVFRLAGPGNEAFVTLALLGGLALTVGAALLGAVFAWRHDQVVAAAILSLFFVSRNVVLNSISAMEWPWVVLLAGLYAAACGRRSYGARRDWLVPLFLGVLGSLARSDFGLWPAAVAVAALLVHRRSGWRRNLLPAWSGLGGAILGVLLVLIHNRETAGTWVSSSASVKVLWVDVYGRSFAPVRELLLSLFAKTSGSTPVLVSLLSVVVLLTGLGSWWNVRRNRRAVGGLAVLWLGSGLAAAGYILLYSCNIAGLQPWYTANLIVPVFLFLSLPFAAWRPPGAVTAATVALIAVLAVRQGPVVRKFAADPPWPCQETMHQAGLYLAQSAETGPVGAWDAGIVGYYAGPVRVVNLDGLVNGDVVPHIKAGTVGAYLAEKGIRRLVARTGMFSSRRHLQRSGLDQAGFLREARPEIELTNEATAEPCGVTIYRLPGAGT